MKKLLSVATAYVLAISAFSVPMVAYGFSCANTDLACYVTGPYNNLTTQSKLDSSGNLSLNGILTISGSGTSANAGSQSVAGKTIYTPTGVVAITSITVISPAATFMTLVSTGGPVTCGLVTTALGAAAPCISTATAVSGQFLILSSTQATSYVILSSGTASGLWLGAATRTIGNGSIIQLLYNSVLSVWKEVSFVQ